MMDTVGVVKQFNPAQTKQVAQKIKSIGKLFLTGEGSSRIFPAKNAIRKARRWGMDIRIATDGSRQSAQYDLSKFAVFCASNSGRTKEVITLAKKLGEIGNDNRFGLSANKGTLLEQTCKETFVLTCGWEQAVAATKSVIEQALFYESILWHIVGKNNFNAVDLSGKIEQALTFSIDPDITQAAVKAPTFILRDIMTALLKS